MNPMPDWNAVRFHALCGQGHVESYFLKANDLQAERAIWIKATIFAANDRPSFALAEAWAIVFRRDGGHVAVKQSIPFGDASFSSETLHIDIGSHLSLSTAQTSGDIDHAGHRIRWNLRLAGDAAPVVMLPSPRMYETAFPKSKLVTPSPNLVCDGSVSVDNTDIAVTGWRGMQGHNWGRAHADQYAWGHCNVWEQSCDVVVEAVSARVRVGPTLSPMMTLVTVLDDDQRYALHGPLELVRNRGEIHPRRWFFRARNRQALVEGDFCAQTDDLVGLYYANPDGSMTYCLNSKLASGRLRLEVRGRPVRQLTTRAAAFELGTKDARHGVRMYV